MPSLPVYQSEKSINAKKAAPATQITQPTFKMDRTIENAMADIAQTWSDSHDVMQYTDAKNKYEVEAAQILAKAAQDPDFKNSKTYNVMLQKAKENSLQGIDNAQVVDKLAMEMDFGNQMASVKIAANFQQKELAHNRFALGQTIEGLNQKRVQATTELEAQAYDKQIQDLLALNVVTGNIDEAEAEEYKDDARVASAEYDATVNPEAFLSRKSSWYGIPEDKFVELKNTARESKKRSKKEAEVALEESQNQNEADLVMQLADKTIDRESVPAISEMIRNGEITEDFGMAYIRLLTNPKSIGKASSKAKRLTNKVYYEMAMELFKAEDPAETRKALIRMFDKSASGEISEADVSLILKAASKAGKNKNMIAGFIEHISKKVVGDPKIKNEYLMLMLGQVAEGKEPEEAKKEANDQIHVKYNPNRTDYTEGLTYETPRGPMLCVGYDEDTGNPLFKKAK